MKPATIKRLKAENAAYEDKYFIHLRNGVTVGDGMTQKEWDKIFKKDAKNVA